MYQVLFQLLTTFFCIVMLLQYFCQATTGMKTRAFAVRCWSCNVMEMAQGPVGQSSPRGQNNPGQGPRMAVAVSRADLYTMILKHRISVQQASFCSRLSLNFRVFWQYECGQEKLLGPTTDKIWELGLHPLRWVASFFQAKATRTVSPNSFLWVTGRWKTSQQRNYQSHFMEKCYFVQATFHKASIRNALG